MLVQQAQYLVSDLFVHDRLHRNDAAVACRHQITDLDQNGPICPEAYPFRHFIQDRMSGQMIACAWRPTRTPRCCKQTPTSPGYCMICVFVVILSVKGTSDARDAIGSAVLITTKVGVHNP